MENFFRQMKMRRNSQYLAVILAVFMLTGAVSGPVCAAYAAEADPAAAVEVWTEPALEEGDADPSAMESEANAATLEGEADSTAMESEADSAAMEAGADSDSAVPEAETDPAATEACADPALADTEADSGLGTQTEAGTEDRASEDGQEVFMITYSANGGGHFADPSWSDGQYIDFTETVGAGTVICSRNSTDLSGDSFEYPSDDLSENDLSENDLPDSNLPENDISGNDPSETGNIEEAVYKIGTAALFADDGNEFLGWSLQEDGAEMIPEEGLEVFRDEMVFAVWKQKNPDEEGWPDEGTGTENETDAETGTEPEGGIDIPTDIPTEAETEANLFPETNTETNTATNTDTDTESGNDADLEAETNPEADPATGMEAGSDLLGEDSAEEVPRPSEAEAGEPAEDGTGINPDEEISEETGSSALSNDEHDDQPAECTVTFDADGGQFYGGESVLTETVRKGAAIRLSDYDKPQKEGCRFRGWSLEKDSAQTVSDWRFRVTENVTLYAVWTEYKTITFNANGGYIGRRRLSEKKVSFETGERIDLNDYEPRPAGWEEFKGWSLSVKGTELLPHMYKVTDSVTLYAVWARKIKDADVRLSTGSYTYNGKARTPAVTVYYENRILKQGTDYTVSYSNNTKAGKATVKITGKGSYEGSTSRKFTINKAPQKLTLSAPASSVSVGKTVKMKASGAKETKKYTYKTSDRSVAVVSSAGVVTAKKVGKVRITVSTAETQNYKSGSCYVTIKVVPGATKKLTAVNQKKGIRITWNKVPGATGYILYRNGKKIATIKKGSTVSYLDKKANAKGKKYVYKLVTRASTGESTLARAVSIVRSLTSRKTASSSGNPQSSGKPSSGTSSSSSTSGSPSSGTSGSGSSSGGSSGSGTSGSGSTPSGTSGTGPQTGSSTGLPLMNIRYCLEEDSVQTALNKCGENDFIVIDFDGVSQNLINNALSRGVQIYAYLNAGSLEQDRSYYSRFSSIRLAEYDGWPGEYWVDVTTQTWKDHLIEEAQKLKAAGASGVYFDNADILYMVETGFREEKTTMLRTAPSAGKVYQALSEVVLTIENTIGLTVMPNGGDTFVRRFVTEYPGVIKTVNQEGVVYDNNRQQPASERSYLTEYLDWCKNKGIYIRGIEYINTKAGADAAKAYYAEHGWDALYISPQRDLRGN